MRWRFAACVVSAACAIAWLPFVQSGGPGVGGGPGAAPPIAAGCDCGESTCLGSSVTQVMPSHTITFTFAEDETCGQYANGDYWVVDDGDVSITSMTPAYSSGSNGWMVNPDSATQTYDQDAANWDVAGPPSLPYAASAGQSIIKAVDRGTCSGNSNFSCLDSVAVLTVVGSAPSTSDFRPPFFGASKPSISTSSIQWSLIPSLTPPASGDIPTLAQVESRYRWPQIDHGSTIYVIRHVQALDNNANWLGTVSDYGEEKGHDIGQAILRLMLDDTQAAKTPAMIAVLQAGIDYYHMWAGGQRWPAEAGLFQGRKAPAVFAAVLLGQASWVSAIQAASGRNSISDPADAAPFWKPNNDWQEDGQIYYSTIADNGNGKVLWGEFKSAWKESDYWAYIDCVDANNGNSVTCEGSRQHGDPYLVVDGGSPQDTSNYQNCCSSGSYVGQALAMMLVTDLRNAWGNEDFFTYVDRWMTVGYWASPDTQDRTIPQAGGTDFDTFHGQYTAANVDGDFVDDMWTSYRGSAPVIP